MKNGRKRVGILTGGGDCPGLNAVIRAAVKSAVLNHQWEIFGIHEGFDGLVNREFQVTPLGMREVQGLLPKGGTILGTTSRGNPFSYPVDLSGNTVYKDVSQGVKARFDELDLDALVVIGGDGTMKIARSIHEMGVPIAAVPKTIDNDVPVTDVSFGFDSAVHCAVDAIDRLHTTAESHNRAMILEVMGRTAGWIALHTGLAGGADLIALPEIPYQMSRLADAVEMRRRRGSRFVTVVVAEGAHPKGEEAPTVPGGKGQLPRLTGAGQRYADLLSEVSDIESRVAVLGHIQRGGSPSPFDRILATRFGVEAIRLIAEEKTGRMVYLSHNDIKSVPLEEIEGQKLVDPDNQMIRAAKSIGIAFGD